MVECEWENLFTVKDMCYDDDKLEYEMMLKWNIANEFAGVGLKEEQQITWVKWAFIFHTCLSIIPITKIIVIILR